MAFNKEKECKKFCNHLALRQNEKYPEDDYHQEPGLQIEY